jgi:hypothetical protein
MVISPLGLIAAALIAWVVARRRNRAGAASEPATVSIAAFSCIWTAVFLAPVLPIVLRSELYLYLPVFGLSLLAGSIAAALLEHTGDRRIAAITIGVFGIALAGYQIARASDTHRDLVFSERFVAALATNESVGRSDGTVALLPADATTERLLRDAIGGYLYVVLQRARPGTQLNAVVQYRGEPPQQADLRLVCAYRQDGSVVISPAP